MAHTIIRTKDFVFLLTVVISTASKGHAEQDYTNCDKAFVPCPRAPGFQFFNKTCYGIIRDTLPFGAGDAFFKCESGMHLAFTDPSMNHHYTKMQRRTIMDRRMTLARIISPGTLHVLTRLRQQVVPEPSESILVGLACSHDCASPDGWTFNSSEAFPTFSLNCAHTSACNWQRPGRSVWAQPPGSEATLDGPVQMPAINTSTGTSTGTSIDAPPLNSRVGVLAAPGALRDAPQTITLNSLACEIPFSTTDEGIKQLMPIGLATDADMSLHAQMVHNLAVQSVDGSETRVLLTWETPHCDVTAFYVTVSSDADDSLQNRSRVETTDVCDEARKHCQMELELPPCSLFYIQLGAILEEEDAAPDVTQWQTPAPADPPTPETIFLSEISGSVVTFTWKSTAGAGPCQPYHVVTVEGHGKVTLKPGVTKLKADLGSHCAHFDVSVMATILGRNGSIRGPIHGVTGPTAPDIVQVLATGSSWFSLQWTRAAGPSSPCVQAKNRVSCQPVTSPGLRPPPTVSMTSLDSRLNVTGLMPGVGYRCGVCALASLMDTAFSDTALTKPPCGAIRFVDLFTNETAPGMPHGLKTVGTSHDGLTMKWRRPEEPNGVIVRYNISVTCEPQTFPLCTSDPLCVDRWFAVPLGGNDTDHVTFAVTGLQAARLHHVTVAAVTAAGHGPFSQPFSAHTRVGVPPPPSHVTVTSQVKVAEGDAEQTSVSVSLRPPCPFPGAHDYRLQLERVDFLAGYQSTVRAAELSPDEIRQLYAGQHNITLSVFDGKWTPGFNYLVRIVATTDNRDLGKRAHAPSAPVNFTMTVPPPGEVRRLTADCSQPLSLSFRWANPTEHAFGIVSYRSRYRCHHNATGYEVTSGGWHSCRHDQCPCVSSQRLTNQCSACERVCNYPIKRFKFMGEQTYYYNCTCERRVDVLAMPGSECQVAVQAESRYLQQRGAMTLASCHTPEHTPRVTDLKVRCDQKRLAASWAVPRPLEVATKAYHVNILRSGSASGQRETFVEETLEGSQCERSECQATWSGLDGDVTYIVQVAAESIYSSPPVGPAAESACLSPARAPRPPAENLQRQVEDLSGWGGDFDPSHQYLLRLPRELYDLASGTLRELRVVVSESVTDSGTASLQPPPSGNLAELPKLATWQQFSANQADHYQASPPAFVPANDGRGPGEFLLGGDASCSPKPPRSGEQSHCNGPLKPNTSYTVQLTFVNDAGFASSRPFTFRTKAVQESEQAKAKRLETERMAAEQAKAGQADQKTPNNGVGQQPRTNLGSLGPSGGGWRPVGGSGMAEEPPELATAPFDPARTADSVTAAAGAAAGDNPVSEVPPESSTTPLPEDSGVSLGTAVGASVGVLLVAIITCVGVFFLRRRSRGGS